MKGKDVTDFSVTYDGVEVYIEVESADFEERISRYIQHLEWTSFQEYEIMHGSMEVAAIAKNGICKRNSE